MSGVVKFVLKRLDKSHTVSAIRRGLIMVIPVLILGLSAQVLENIPVDGYQRIIESLFDGAFLEMLGFIYNATFGMLSVYIVLSITNCYLGSRGLTANYIFVGSLTAVASFFAVSGVSISHVNSGVLGTKGVFSAIFCATLVSRLYVLIVKNLKIPFRLYADGVDLEFNDAIITMIPLISITLLFSMFNYLVCQIFQMNSFQDFYVHIVNHIFSGRESSFVNGFMYIIVSGLLGFFGIYGSDVLESAQNRLFQVELVKDVQNITELSDVAEKNASILNKQFIQVFVMLGGYGVAFGLLLSIFIFSKRKISKNLMKISAIPMIFNFSDVLSFGYPVIFNAYLLAPFLVVPAVAYCVSYFAFYFDLVPLMTHAVNPTTPIFISGYMATRSIYGVLLQLLILLISVFIYLPFVKWYDGAKSRNEAERMKELTDILKKAEEDKAEIEVLRLPGTPGALARCLAADLESAIDHQEVDIKYQLQYDKLYNCIGAETLMRYTHPIHGFIYPPLIVKIAEEGKLLGKLERSLFIQAAKDYRRIKNITNKSYKLSVNVTVATLLEDDFIDFLRQLKQDYRIMYGEMCIEITEQMAIKSDEDFETALNEVKKLGYLIAIDDFSMGSTSLKYLQSNQFDIVKLDGAIVRDMMKNERSKDIISSIVYLSSSLHFKVLAEYVESEEQIDELEKVGIDYYQGYRFSKAVSIDEFLQQITNEKEGKSQLKSDYRKRLAKKQEQEESSGSEEKND